MSPGDGDDPSEAGHAYIVELGPGGLSALMEKVVASLTGFQQLNAAERGRTRGRGLRGDLPGGEQEAVRSR
ncbi:hypothetical protein [Streptomyces bacillaris]|uniref:hypothetical protein n=1 Tax=Streptomyces bacillaris TaxID=68179 RepID=UPI00364386C7